MTPEIVEGYQTLDAEILRLKYVLAKVADSYNLDSGKKAAFRDRVVAFGEELNAHMQAVANNRPTKYNMDEFERSEGACIRRCAEDLRALQTAGLRLLHSKVNFRRTVISESEVDDQLATGRIFDAPTLGKDKLDHLGAVRRFLKPESSRPEPRQPGVERELQRLKLESYARAVGKWKNENPDILFKTRAKIEATLSARGCSFVAAEAMQRGDMPNRGEALRGSGGSRRFRAALLRGVRLPAPRHLPGGLRQRNGVLGQNRRVGRSGAARTEFSVVHPRSGARVDSEGGHKLLKEFLEVTAAAPIYQAVSGLYEEFKRRDAARSERAEKEARDKVSRALDELL